MCDAKNHLEKKLIKLVKENIEIHANISRHTLLLKDLNLDSMNIFHIISALENQFSIKIDDADIILKNFCDIISLAELLRGKYEINN